MSIEQDREMNHLNQIMRDRYEPWLADVKKAGFNYQPYETMRTAERQNWLYASGRTRTGDILTKTLDSAHEYGLAVDGMVLIWSSTDRAWIVDWSTAAYNRIYTKINPARYGLELLPWERPHIQLKGVNGANLQTPVSVFAARMGIKPNKIVGSVWPKPIAAPPIPATPIVSGPKPRGRILVQDENGEWSDVNDKRSLLFTRGGERIIINAQAPNGDIYLSGAFLTKESKVV